jgi:hypothetical protein
MPPTPADTTVLGAHSWLEAATWIAALVAAFIAAISLRRQSLQSRAALLLQLYERWETLDGPRKEFGTFYNHTRTETVKACTHLQQKYQDEQIRDRSKILLTDLLDKSDPKLSSFIKYVSFFETLGTYVRNNYVSVLDVIYLYKEPILVIDIVFGDFVRVWQKRSHMPPGLFENALYLAEAVKAREAHPRYYRVRDRIVAYLT